MFFFAAAEPGRFEGGRVSKSSIAVIPGGPVVEALVGGLRGGAMLAEPTDANDKVSRSTGFGVELIDGGFVTADLVGGTGEIDGGR